MRLQPDADQPLPEKQLFEPATARYFDQIHELVQFTDEELALLSRNGFVATDRLYFEQFKRAYAWIYWRDLPVLVTTDSILHAIHQTYDKLLKRVELEILIPKWVELLTAVRDYLRNTRNAAPAEVYGDLDAYLAVPLALLSNYRSKVEERVSVRRNAQVRRYLKQIKTVNDASYHSMKNWPADLPLSYSKGYHTPPGIEAVTLFGLSRQVDFTQFQARGHYDEPAEAVGYFAAMMWIQQIDFRFVEFDSSGNPTLHRAQLAAAHLLWEAIHATLQHDNWREIDTLLNAFVGWSDNITLRGLAAFIRDAGIRSAQDYFEADEARLLHLLQTNDYGHQRIRAQMQTRREGEHEISHNISFMLMGQRFTVESFIMQELIYDRLVVNGEHVKRAYPNPLDVMAALGSQRAKVHLADELQQYGYGDRLEELRTRISTYSHEFWYNSFYNLWLNAIRALNEETRSANYPAAMRTEAWSDKTLHTQLASWAQLRHDHILYTKPPYAPGAICEYPAGYVEPYQDFYLALHEYALFGRRMFQQITMKNDVLLQEILRYFTRLEEIMLMLYNLSVKELNHEPFTQEDKLFLRSVVVRKSIELPKEYGGKAIEQWNGWYIDLLPFDDQSPILTTDFYTQYDSSLGTPGVQHMGTGDVAAIALIVNQESEVALYIGPMFTYYELFEPGFPPRRLTDNDWRFRLLRRLGSNLNYPQTPVWADSFFSRTTGDRKGLDLPIIMDNE